jgi:hypothetical protein
MMLLAAYEKYYDSIFLIILQKVYQIFQEQDLSIAVTILLRIQEIVIKKKTKKILMNIYVVLENPQDFRQ